MEIDRVLHELRSAGVRVSRRHLLRMAAFGGLATAGAAALAACGGGEATPAATTDTGAGAGTTATAGGGAATPAATGTTATGGTPKKGGVWKMAITGNPTAYPITVPGALVDILVNKTIFNGLVHYALKNNAIQVVPDLADSWTPNSDLTEWTFKLKSGVKWHDGQPFTANDVKFTIEAILNPKVNAQFRGTISAIDRVEVVDDQTAKLVTKYPYAPLPVILGYNIAMVPKHLLDGQDLNQPTEFLKKPIGTGPFKFKQFSQGSFLETEANPDYFGGAPYLDGIIYKIIPDGNARVAQVKSGEIDFTVVEPAQVDTLAGQSNIDVRKAPQVNYYFFAVNHSDPRLQDVRVRQALSYAVDKDAIVKNFLKGYGQVATGPINPLLGDYYNANAQKYPYDLQKAQSLLEQAGWKKGSDGILANDKGEKFNLVFNGPKGYPVMEQVITYAQQQYQKLGFQITLEIVDWPVHLDKYHKLQYGILMEWWITPPDPDLYDHYYSKSPSNWWAYNNPQVDDLIVQARKEPDQTKRVQLYQQLQDVIAKDLPVIYLYYPQELQAMNTRTRDLPLMGYRDALTWMNKVWVDK